MGAQSVESRYKGERQRGHWGRRVRAQVVHFPAGSMSSESSGSWKAFGRPSDVATLRIEHYSIVSWRIRYGETSDYLVVHGT